MEVKQLLPHPFLMLPRGMNVNSKELHVPHYVYILIVQNQRRNQCEIKIQIDENIMS